MDKILKNSDIILKCRKTACSLDICLTNRCNMSCQYCYYETLNAGKPLFLSFEQIKAGVESYLKGRDFSKLEKISIAGGEPFLYFPLVDKTVEFLRKRINPPVKIEVFTNGTLLNKNNVSKLVKKGVNLTLSLDGAMSSNDRNRVFRSNNLESSFKVVMKNLEKIPPKLTREMSIGMTVTANNVLEIANNVRFLRGLGFKEVQLNLRYLEIWDAKSLSALKKGLDSLNSYYKELVFDGLSSFTSFRFGLDFLQLKEKSKALALLPGFREFSLGPDGFFYPCGLITTYGKEKYRYRIGDTKTGPDYIKAARLRVLAAKFLRKMDKRYNLTKYISNPILLYFGIKLNGINPDKLFSSIVDVFMVFEEKLGQYLKAEKIMSDLSCDRKFGDMDHLPPKICDTEIKTLKMDLRENLGEPADFRDTLDYFLYSQGKFKNLTVLLSESALSFEVFERIVFYSLMKTSKLQKKLRITLEISDYWLNAGEINFLAEHKIALSLLKTDNISRVALKALAKKLGKWRVICGVNILPAKKPGGIIKKLVDCGLVLIRFQIKTPAKISSNYFSSFKKELDKTAKFLSKLESVFIENCFSHLSRDNNSCTYNVSLDKNNTIILKNQNIGQKPLLLKPSLNGDFETIIFQWWKKISLEIYLKQKSRKKIAIKALKNLSPASGLFSRKN
ncbi:MAG: radical SAM protein [Elusimicrobiota bacterium]|nr:radical SAM protein [Elusimicrobiota bacterium]